jgi:hypothetical protein
MRSPALHAVSSAAIVTICGLSCIAWFFSHEHPKVGGVGNPALPIGTMRFRLACPDNLVNPVFVRHVLLLAIPPVTGFTTTVHHRKHKDPIRTDRKKDCVWKY